MRYAVFGCRKTHRLWQETKEEYGTWIPLERDGSVVIHGVVFVPWRMAGEFRRRMPDFYNVRQYYFRLTKNPAFVERKELEEMQRTLNAEATVAAFAVGDLVEVPLFDARGEVVALKAGNRLRIRVDGLFLNLHRNLCKKILDSTGAVTT